MNVLFCIQMERPLRYATSLHELTNLQIRYAMDNKYCLPGDHWSSYSTYCFLHSLNACQRQIDTDDICSATFFSLQVDESNNITLQKSALVFVNILNSTFQLRTIHWALLPLDSSTVGNITSAINHSFSDRDVSLERCILFVLDGASTMLGCRLQK